VRRTRARAALAGLAILVAAGCSRVIPSHLLRDAPSEAARAADWSTVDAALETSLAGDPLWRSPRLPPDPQTWRALGLFRLADAVDAVRTAEAWRADLPARLQGMEPDLRGDASLAYLRGYRDALAEAFLGRAPADDDLGWAEVATLLTPLPPEPPDSAGGLLPVAWLDAGAAAAIPGAPIAPGGARVVAARASLDRRALLAWLDSPRVPVAAAAHALDRPTWEALAATPAGRLVLARAAGLQQEAPPSPDPGLASLERATSLALAEVTADTDAEQVAWRALRDAAAAELGAPDPIDALLRRAEAQLREAAGRDAGAGGALLAQAALRWRGACEDAPCAGLDRVDTMTVASGWSPEVAPYAAAWRVIALAEATEGMTIGRDTVRFPYVLVDLVDALVGTGARPPEAGVLARRRPDAYVWRHLGLSLGVDPATTWDEVRAALSAHLAREADAAAAWAERASPPLAAPLLRVARAAQNP
jgi:hypothetical protein